jgi:sterol desaturase/sphingolipid hydroxylase (fatty acid hydroxylase superfamily)
VWLTLALVDYAVFPYDFAAAADLAAPAFRGFLARRFAVNCLFVWGFFGFWHVSLYGLGWAKRKFNPASRPSPQRVAHNVWYTTLGVAQWTVWEACFVHCFATGRIPHVSDAAAFATAEGAARFVACFFLVPLFRDLHFYFAHRLIHVRCLYKYVHALHHRNTDIEPFSGLCMHPIEHLYYFACVCPLLYCLSSPLGVTWMGMHLLLSPAASHSGWEDHFQSDQYHYLHHAKFECNYGTSGIPFDHWFGTFRETLGKSRTYRGEATASDVAGANPGVVDRGVVDRGVARPGGAHPGVAHPGGAHPGVDGAERIVRADRFRFPALPKRGMGAYFAATAGILGVFLLALLDRSNDGAGAAVRAWRLELPGVGPKRVEVRSPQLVGALVSAGPVLAGLVGCVLSRDRFPLTWPFHKTSVLGGFGFHTLVGFVFCVLPVYHLVEAVLGERGEAAYCRLWGGCL